MKNLSRLVTFAGILISAFSCKEHKQAPKDITKVDLQVKIDTLNAALIAAARTKDFKPVADIYLDDALLLAEYNPLIDGKANIERFYAEIFKRQNILAYQKKTTELFDFGETILEIGEFKKTIQGQQKQEGKYFNVWQLLDTGILKLKSETFGFYHPMENPSELSVHAIKDSVKGLSSRNGKNIPLELEAYDARNENIVRDRDSQSAARSYTNDGAYYPFANTKIEGIENLRKHYTAYHSGTVKIDTIEVWTYDYEPVKDGVLKYNKFYVEWSVPELSGITEGTGLIYYRRQDDNALKIHRQIGLHIHKD